MMTQELWHTQSAVNFAARFGFINQGIFFKYLCQKLKSQQYRYWRKLTANGHFKASASDRNILYLTKKGRELAQFEPVAARSVYLVPHDLLVATVILELEMSGLVTESWTEAELLCSPATTYQVLGVNRIDKLPDLVVDLRANQKALRIAFEIENSRKAKERYDRMALNYLAMKNVNLVIFGAANLMISKSIRRAFSGAIFQNSQKTPIIFSNEDFKSEGFAAQAELLQTQLPLRKMLLAALEADSEAWVRVPEKNRNAVCLFPENSNGGRKRKSKPDQVFGEARPRPGPLASFRDHPHPTMLTDGGHEPGAGVGRGPDLTGEEERAE